LIVTWILCWWSLLYLREIFLIILLICDLLGILSFFIATLRSIFEVFNFQGTLDCVWYIIWWYCPRSVASSLKVHAWLWCVARLRNIHWLLLLFLLKVYWNVCVYLKSIICYLMTIQFWIPLLQTVSQLTIVAFLNLNLLNLIYLLNLTFF
jgi:hypothetical protein